MVPLPSLAEIPKLQVLQSQHPDPPFRLAFFDRKPEAEPESGNAGAQRRVWTNIKVPN